jgi:glycolate oxidase FAD binding subunit
MQEVIDQFVGTLQKAAQNKTPVRTRGGGSKDFYAETLLGDILDVSPHKGIVGYEPKELVITARGGTPLKEIETTLMKCAQMLPFEPPHFGGGATLGGCVASGLSGPRRAYAGSVRDFVLGVRMLDGRGKDLRFGGQVMKNVAGYDVSRLMAGSLGTLGVLLEISLKVLPLPHGETTLQFEMNEDAALRTLNAWATLPLPVSATCFSGKTLSVRLSGSMRAVHAAMEKLGGSLLAVDEPFWRGIREHSMDFFQSTLPLWRLSIPCSVPPLNLPGEQLIEWGGALRWLKTDASGDTVRRLVTQVGGQAVLFRGAEQTQNRFHPLAAPLLALHRRLKKSFDPHGILNPGRMYAGL